MHIFCNGDEPSIKLKFRIVAAYFVKCFCKSFDGNVFRVRFVFSSFEHKTVHFVPVIIQQERKGNLVAVFCFFYTCCYFHCAGFEKRLVMKIFSCVKISTISRIGNQNITSFSFNFPAPKPSDIHENKYLKTTKLTTAIH